MIHQIKPDKIPQSKFNVMHEVDTEKTMRMVKLFVAFILMTSYILFFDNWKLYLSSMSSENIKNSLLWTTNSIYPLFFLIICIIIFGMTVYYLVLTQKNTSILRKIKFQGNEIEIFKESDDSYFDKYLNEVLYLFENADTDVFVFEDLDRYNANQIFERLREVNSLINNQRFDRKQPIKFFYLLRDDIFVSKDRTKFFDFIVPIVPVIDGSNSFDKFIEHFEKGNLLKNFDGKFLQDISLYVDDMRILKNIYNEYVIYNQCIQSTELDDNKILAMIIYKNVFPRDFCDLQLGLGFVHALFAKKEDLIKEDLRRIDEEIIKVSEQLNLVRTENMVSVDELEAVLLLANYSFESVAGKSANEYQSRAELLRAIKENSYNASCYMPNQGYRIIDLSSDFNRLYQNQDYIKRKEAIENKSAKKTENLKEQIQILQKEKTIHQNFRLHEILKNHRTISGFDVEMFDKKNKGDEFFEIASSPYFPLIKYLIRNGYINETYSDYMTYFYPNSLSTIDKAFLRSITDQQSKEYTYELTKPETVVTMLRDADFNHCEVLNFSLLKFLLKNKEEHGDYLASFLRQLRDTKNYDFIGSFLNKREEIPLFVKNINNQWSSIFFSLINESDLSEVQLKEYAINTLSFTEATNILALNINECLTEFISRKSSFLKIETLSVEKITEGLQLLQVKFDSIDYNISNNDLFVAVYHKNLYQISFENISLMLNVFYGFFEKEDLVTKNYTLVSSQPQEPLVQYLEENINLYIEILLNQCNGNIVDNENIVLKVLNNELLETGNKEKYIDCLKNEIRNLKSVENKNLWSFILQKKIVFYSVENMVSYFLENGLNDVLIEFINSESKPLCFASDSVARDFDSETRTQFFKAIVICNKLINNRYEAMVKTLERRYEKTLPTEITDDKILILIKSHVIMMTTETLLFMRENYPAMTINFIVENIETYAADILDQDNFEFYELLLILEQDLKDSTKIKLLNLTENDISIQEKDYTEVIKKYILENNFNVDDIPYILENYFHESSEIQQSIVKVVIRYISTILNGQDTLPKEMLSKLFIAEDLSIESKMELFVQHLPEFSREECKNYLETLQLNDFQNLLDGGNPKFKVSNTNEQILKIFREKYWISSFDFDKKNSDFYRANSRRVFNKIPAELL